MEILLLIIAGIVLYMLYTSFQDYMKNPYKVPSAGDLSQEYKPEDNPYVEQTPKQKIEKTEFGVLAQILAHIARGDGEVCALERELISDILDDCAAELRDLYPNAREILGEIFEGELGDLDALARDFTDASKGEYKKRVKVVEFLFALAYADGKLDEAEREKIIDIAAIFELNNDDFNALYDDFEKLYASEVEITQKKALEILDLNENHTKDDLERAYSEKIKAAKQNIFKTARKKDASARLREIDSAYLLLKDEIKKDE